VLVYPGWRRMDLGTVPKDAPPAEIAKQAFAEAMQRYEKKDYHQAVELLRTAVHHVPDEARYHAALAMALACGPPAAPAPSAGSWTAGRLRASAGRSRPGATRFAPKRSAASATRCGSTCAEDIFPAAVATPTEVRC